MLTMMTVWLHQRNIIVCGRLWNTRAVANNFQMNDDNKYWDRLCYAWYSIKIRQKSHSILYAIEKLLLAQFISLVFFPFLLFSFRTKQFCPIQDNCYNTFIRFFSHFYFISFLFLFARSRVSFWVSVRVLSLIRSFTPFVYCFSITAK